MKRNETSAEFNGENGGLLSRRLSVEAYTPIDAPLKMPTHQLPPALDGWWRRLRSQAALVITWKRPSWN